MYLLVLRVQRCVFFLFTYFFFHHLLGSENSSIYLVFTGRKVNLVITLGVKSKKFPVPTFFNNWVKRNYSRSFSNYLVVNYS